MVSVISSTMSLGRKNPAYRILEHLSRLHEGVDDRGEREVMALRFPRSYCPPGPQRLTRWLTPGAWQRRANPIWRGIRVVGVREGRLRRQDRPLRVSESGMRAG